jgi:hypothetical protein
VHIAHLPPRLLWHVTAVAALAALLAAAVLALAAARLAPSDGPTPPDRVAPARAPPAAPAHASAPTWVADPLAPAWETLRARR